ncbi:universal stress protein [Cryobacterium psychrophilum]|uniref:Universal stress protein n=1 Tax=Cryobacterium psychrophilum TaxID=41988 RepID=A0A4Y8KPE8_9MICO|nr:universal stress protein [Cryobacterium psychrophilum]TDW30507.1 nucleotide-binding universal stress UspA family protein [Cryobacterium psychrophilum]TFD76321.1 universal stress protein [Cryobacterium psychrophilum]
MTAKPIAHVIVGVLPGQPDAVVLQAATFAQRFDAELVCAYVDVNRYMIFDLGDGSMTSFPIDQDLLEPTDPSFDPALLEHLTTLLGGLDLSWSTRALAGDPALALGALADTIDAAMIVVGTREATVRATLGEFFNGAVAVHLAHRQHRPVVVIPLAPVPLDKALPWNES